MEWPFNLPANWKLTSASLGTDSYLSGDPVDSSWNYRTKSVVLGRLESHKSAKTCMSVSASLTCHNSQYSGRFYCFSNIIADLFTA